MFIILPFRSSEYSPRSNDQNHCHDHEDESQSQFRFKHNTKSIDFSDNKRTEKCSWETPHTTDNDHSKTFNDNLHIHTKGQGSKWSGDRSAQSGYESSQDKNPCKKPWDRNSQSRNHLPIMCSGPDNITETSFINKPP